MIRHVLLFKFRASATPQQRAQAIAMLKALPAAIPEIREWSIGEQAFASGKAHDVAQVSGFDDEAGLQRYRAHPAHVQMREYMSQIADWAVVDYVM